MSDLNPKGVKVELGEQEYELLFTINAIDEIQTRCNAPVFDAIRFVAEAADGNLEHDTLVNFRTITAVLASCCNNSEELTEKEVGQLITLKNYRHVAWAILTAYGFSLPDPDEDDEIEDKEEETPNVETGQ